MAGMHLLYVVCLAGPWMASAVRKSNHDVSEELEGGRVVSNASMSLRDYCAHELNALAKSVAAKRQIEHSAVKKFIGGMLRMQGVAAHAYGVPHSVGDVDCTGLVKRVFEAAETGWFSVQNWKAKCSDPSSCISEGLMDVGLTPDQLTEEDWDRLSTDFALLYNSEASDCQSSCDAWPDCKACKAMAQGDSCPMYADQEGCRYLLIRKATCPCIRAFMSFLDSDLYVNTLKSLEHEMKINIPKEDNSVINRECKAKPPGVDLEPVGVTEGGAMVAGASELMMKQLRAFRMGVWRSVDYALGVRGPLYLDDPSEGSACAPGYTCQQSKVWRSEYIGHYGAPLLIGATYGCMKVAEVTIVVAASHALCGPAWFACWTTYATSIPASEIVMAGVVSVSRPLLTRKAVTCLPTPCMYEFGKCVVPGPDPTDHTQLIPGVKCTIPETIEEAEELEGQCKLSFCSHHETAEGPREDGSLWHCAEGRSNLDPEATSLAARAARMRVSQANICEDDGVDHEAQDWFYQELEEYRNGHESCIQDGLDDFGIKDSGTSVLAAEDVLYDLFEATRLRKGAVCAKGCPGVPSLVRAKCMTQRMAVTMVPGVWKKHKEGPPEGCKAALLKVFLCKCAEKYGRAPTSHRSLGQKTEVEEETISAEKAFSDFLG